ncbi:unnamed protein product [Effrenium voratum]|uniref:Dephospho-CoA kinase n=2 Tax=Effrenium voratum TaxID=2562239 RepID=A0AA36JJ80_9DINO|nr:unnamed protein product [Effrenium voratum]
MSKSPKRAMAGKVRRRGRNLGDTLVVGLTGSIGMGKSTVSRWLQEMSVPLDDADATVHRLYAPAGDAVRPVTKAFGEKVVGKDGGIDRGALSKLVVGEENKERLQQLEAIVHPLVEASRDLFIADAQKRNEPLCVLDIPLLFEKQLEKHCDLVVVVSAPAEQQRARVLARNDMTPEKFMAILAKQVPDAEKRLMADWVVDTGLAFEESKAQVVAFVKECREKVAGEKKRERTLYLLFMGAALLAGAAAAMVAQRALRRGGRSSL